jgi:hypothetical protein
MKKFKKISAVAVAMAMGCSVFAFTACNPAEDTPPVSNLPKGIPAQAIDSSFVSAIQEEKNYVTLNFTNSISGTEKHTETTNGVETGSDTTTYEINSSVNGKIDIENGDADLAAKSEATYENDKGKDVSEELSENNFVSYAFLRDWNAFLYDTPDNKEVTDFTDKVLEYGGSFKINWEDILSGFLPAYGTTVINGATALDGAGSAMLPDLSFLPQTGDLIKLSLAGENCGLVQLAAAANTIVYENGVYSIDLIKTLNTALTEIGSVIYALKGTNTVGEILNNDIIKKYFSIYTNVIPVEEAKAAVATGIDALYEIEDIKPLMPFFKDDLAAVKNVTANDTYDYIVALISSENVLNIANNIVSIAMEYVGRATPAAEISSGSQDALFTKTFDKYTVSEILSTVNALLGLETPVTLNFLQTAYKNNIVPLCDGEKLYINPELNDLTVITDLNVEYKVEGGKLASQKFNYAFEKNSSFGGDFGFGFDDESVTTYISTKTTETLQGCFELVYETSAPALTDISENLVPRTEMVWDEDDLKPFNVYDSRNDVQIEYFVGAWVENGEYVGVKVYDADKNIVNSGSGYVPFLVSGTMYYVYENGKYEVYEYSYVEIEAGKDYDADSVVYLSLSTKAVEKVSTVAQIIAENA